MKMRIKFVLATVIFLNLFAFVCAGFCAPPAGQTIGGITRQDKDIEKKKELEQKIQTPKPAGAEATAKEVVPEDAGPKVTINSFKVDGAALLTAQEIQSVTQSFEGKDLSFRSMQKVADLITDEYRKKGYLTSRAYIPPQNVKDGVLNIRVVEGKLGTMQIKGNRYFSTSMLQKKLDFGQQGYFDYSALQRSLVYINEHPDRKAKVTLLPGTTPGSTDVIVDVKDQLPIHVGFQYDNYGSRYINKNRYSLTFEDNNLIGFDDKLFLKVQEADNSLMHLQQGRYSFFPVQPTEVGAYFVNSDIKLGREFRDLESKGKAQIYGLYLNHALSHDQNLDLRLTSGFDYKDISNYQLGTKISRDNVRLFKVGVDVDQTDEWGRTIFTPEIGQGIPHIMGGMKSKDDLATRAGSGGKFTKAGFNLYRLQSMPFETSFLWKNNALFTNNALVASEQFQIGGPGSVRGYPVAEYSGDVGYYTSPELSIPIYVIPKSLRVPFSGVSMYDANRFVLFYDWATTQLTNAQAGEHKKETLRGWGFGWRVNVKDNMTFRVEVGYPLGNKTPSDSDHAHAWVEFTAKY
jgi:hemolysin activation/secretion protein